MGLFGSSKKTYVSSTVYNLAGDSKPVNYVRTALFGSILKEDRKMSHGEAITNSLITGPGAKLKRYSNWAKTSGYSNTIGQTQSEITISPFVDYGEVSQLIPHDANEEVFIQLAEITGPDYEYLAVDYISKNFPHRLNEEWTVDYVERSKVLIITFEKGSSYYIQDGRIDASSRYLYVAYNIFNTSDVIERTTGKPEIIGDGEPTPSLEGWTLLDSKVEHVFIPNNTVVTTLIEYSDGVTPPITLRSHSFGSSFFSNSTKRYYKDSYLGSQNSPDSSLRIQRDILVIQEGAFEEEINTEETEIVELSPTVTKTTTVKEQGTKGIIRKKIRYDKEIIAVLNPKPLQVFIYRERSGNSELDKLFPPRESFGEFVPFIPIRHFKKFISKDYLPDVYAASVKAAKRSMDATYSDIVDKIADNENVYDIDFTYVVFGASLNAKDHFSLEYIYRFFDKIYSGSFNPGSFLDWEARYNLYRQSMKKWQEWLEGQSSIVSGLFGTPAPAVIPMPEMPTSEVRITSSRVNYDMRISWKELFKDTGPGLAKPGAKVGEYWIERGGAREYPTYINYDARSLSDPSAWQNVISIRLERIYIYHQVSANSWERLSILGLKHENYVYKGKAVSITAFNALNDPDLSGFIIPIHRDILDSMSLIDVTQLAQSTGYLVFNSYQVVRKKWYQSGLFKFILAVVIVVVSIYTGGAGAAGGSGILGSNVAVGVALGATASITMAAIVGAIANSIAAMIMTQLIMKATTYIVDDKAGFLIAAIASFVALNITHTVANSSAAFSDSLASSFHNMLKADNLINLTKSIGSGYSQMISTDTQKLLESTQGVWEEFKDQSRIITQAYQDNLGTNLDLFNPMELTDVLSNITIESADSFLTRTLLTGMDIAEISMEMIEKHSKITLSTDVNL